MFFNTTLNNFFEKKNVIKSRSIVFKMTAQITQTQQKRTKNEKNERGLGNEAQTVKI